MTALCFRPVDAAAEDGAFHLVRDDGGMQHCAQFADGSWRYACGKPVSRAIREVCSRG